MKLNNENVIQAIKEFRILLEKETREIEDRLEDLINCYGEGTVNDIIEQQQNDLGYINELLDNLEY